MSVCKLRALVIRFLLPMPTLGRIGDSAAGRIRSKLEFTATRFKLIPEVAGPMHVWRWLPGRVEYEGRLGSPSGMHHRRVEKKEF